MIKINGKKIVIEGTEDLVRDIRTFIELFTNNDSVSKIGFGFGYENASTFFNMDCLLRIIFTICGSNKDEFHNLLKSIEKIIDECNDGEFILEYQEGKDDNEDN